MFWAGLAFLGFLQITASGAEPAAGPRPGRLRRTRTAPEPRNAARAAPAKQWALLMLLILFIGTPLSQYFFAVVSWFVDLFGVSRPLVGDRHRPDPVLVGLAVGAPPCDICVIAHTLDPWVRATITEVATPVSAG